MGREVCSEKAPWHPAWLQVCETKMGMMTVTFFTEDMVHVSSLA